MISSQVQHKPKAVPLLPKQKHFSSFPSSLQPLAQPSLARGLAGLWLCPRRARRAAGPPLRGQWAFEALRLADTARPWPRSRRGLAHGRWVPCQQQPGGEPAPRTGAVLRTAWESPASEEGGRRGMRGCERGSLWLAQLKKASL